MTDALIVGGARSPIGRRRGALADAHPAELLGTVITTSLSAAGIDPADVDQIIAGCVTTAGDQANNIARTAWLTAGLPIQVPGITVDARCGSSQQAVHFATGLVKSGAADLVVCGGVEHMSRHPLGQDVGTEMGQPLSPAYRDLFEVTSQGEAAERIAEIWKIDRAYADELALASQERAAAAIAAGRFDGEIAPIGDFATDEGPRPSTAAGLAGLKTVFRDADHGILTAGNSSQISDGASCVIVASGRYAAEHGLAPLAEIEHQLIIGVDPVLKLTGPIPATQEILKRSGLALSDIGAAEVNEAFASVLGAWLRELEYAHERTNVNGGAIALGHPVGATGTRLVLTSAHELRAGGHERTLVTMCCGGGLGTATVLKAA
ncbi:thiolase family protein [Nocardia jinanensis]|uniref:Acetyl-CoA acetyltransferase n=1 Tax=Nocardia jinanensis TaxID=382504 RepID=A0A917VTJ1_9NOCA|nr:thiolase family protein [Nocardia jinanensis]GGL12715.1 acetyl-CoA acetyltransferase [Nocardia jinanensis]